MWDHTAVAADSKLVVSLVVGKRTQAQTHALVHDVKHRLRPGHLPAILGFRSNGAKNVDPLQVIVFVCSPLTLFGLPLRG